MSRPYKIISDQLYEDKVIDTTRHSLNAIVFTNRGTNPVKINGEPLGQDQSLSNSGWQNEIDNSQYTVTFDTSGGGTSELYVRMKIYL